MAKRKQIEITAIYKPTTNDLLTDPKDVLAMSLEHNVCVLKKQKSVQPEDMDEAKRNNYMHDTNMFTHITKAGMESRMKCLTTWQTSTLMKWYEKHK